LPLSDLKGSGTICKSCSATHAGGCDATAEGVKDITCLSGNSYCYSKVIYTDGDYYNAMNDASAYGHEVEIIYEERGCRSAEVTPSCTTVTSDVGGSNINVYSCEETCTGDKCNTDWPMRPRCSQCNGYHWDPSTGSKLTESDVTYIDHCKLTPPTPVKCPDPSYMYCYAAEKYVADGDNDVKWGYSNEFHRGCMKEEDFSKCKDYRWRDEREAHLCQFVCSDDDCNLGSPADKLTLATGAILASLASFALSLMQQY